MMSGNLCKSSALFVVLMNMNQTYLFYAPVYFVYILTSFCNPLRIGICTVMKTLIQLALILAVGFGSSILPFYFGFQSEWLLARVFPFFTGLIFGDLWAPNTWALYNGLDTILIIIRKVFDPEYNPEVECAISMQPALGAFVPEPEPIHTLYLTCLMLLPILTKLLLCPNRPSAFVYALVLCCFTSFMFGW